MSRNIKIKYEFSSGIFLILAVALFVLSVFILGREREIFANQELFQAVFTDVKGLAVGAPVRLGGITVGHVDQIGFSNDVADVAVHVGLQISDRYVERIKVDSFVEIATQGLLGDRYVNIHSGVEKQQLLPGAVLRSQETEELADLASRASKVVANAVTVSEDLKAMTGEAKQTTLKSLNQVTQDLQQLLKEVKEGQGLLHTMIYETSSGNLGETLTKLNQTVDNLKVATDALRNGSGTLGALLVDPQLYDNLTEITDQAKRSLLLRQIIRNSMEK